MRRALLVAALLVLAACGSDDSGEDESVSTPTTAATTAVGTVGRSVSSTPATVTTTAAVSTPTTAATTPVDTAGLSVSSTPATVTTTAAVSTPTTAATTAVGTVGLSVSSTPATVTTTAVVSTPTVNTGTFTETFTGTDGNDLANGWSDDSGYGGTDPLPVYRSNRGSTDSSSAQHVAHKLHGLTLTSHDWQIDFDCYAPLVIGDGGVNVGVLSNTTFQGWTVFIGNAVHIQKFNSGGTHDNLTNVDRPGGSGSLQNHVTFTHRGSDGFMEVFLDGVSWATVTDNSQSAGNMVYLSVKDVNSPSTQSWIDTVVVSDTITFSASSPTPSRP